MPDLKLSHQRRAGIFQKPGVLFRDITPLLRDHFDATVRALDALLTEEEWSGSTRVAGINARGFILGAAGDAPSQRFRAGEENRAKLPPSGRCAWTSNTEPASWNAERGNGRLVLIDDVLATGGTQQVLPTYAQTPVRIEEHFTLIDLHIVDKFHWRNLA